MENLAKPPENKVVETSVADLLPPIILLPDEDGKLYKSLRQTFMAELKPLNTYQTAIAEDIVFCQWELLRHRRIRDNILRGISRTRLSSAFLLSSSKPFPKPGKLHEDESDLIEHILGQDEQKRDAAIKNLENWKIDLGDVLAETFTVAATEPFLRTIEIQERKIVALEKSRKNLRLEFDNLKSAQSLDFEDAEVIVDN